jgi:peptidyl-prolyl cis-trans isomerase C
MTRFTLLRTLTVLSLILILTLAACGTPGSPAQSTSTPTLASSPTPSPTPTVTPVPPAVSVNGEGITRPGYEAELLRYQQAQTGLGNTISQETAAKTVSNELIDLLLLAQGAAAKGYRVDDAALQGRIDDLISQVGGSAALTDWQTAHGYTDAAFRSNLRLQMEAAYMRDQLAASVPATAEQVHVKQILLYNEEAARQALDYLKAGWKFEELAARYDPVTRGELGWFPRGYLSDLAVETAAFALQPGQSSDIIQTQAGYEILYLVELDPARALSPDALLTLQERAVQDWLAQQRSKSTILFTP